MADGCGLAAGSEPDCINPGYGTSWGVGVQSLLHRAGEGVGRYGERGEFVDTGIYRCMRNYVITESNRKELEPHGYGGQT